MLVIGFLGKRYLVLSDNNPKDITGPGLIVDVNRGTVERIKHANKELGRGAWKQEPRPSERLDELCRRVPEFRRFRGIQIQLASGECAWINHGKWTCESPDLAQKLEALQEILGDKMLDSDSDHVRASFVAEKLGAAVLDHPRSTFNISYDGY